MSVCDKSTLDQKILLAWRIAEEPTGGGSMMLGQWFGIDKYLRANSSVLIVAGVSLYVLAQLLVAGDK